MSLEIKAEFERGAQCTQSTWPQSFQTIRGTHTIHGDQHRSPNPNAEIGDHKLALIDESGEFQDQGGALRLVN